MLWPEMNLFFGPARPTRNQKRLAEYVAKKIPQVGWLDKTPESPQE
jgi:hypothetical protein